MTKKTEPSIDQVLEGGEPWSSFRMHEDPEVAGDRPHGRGSIVSDQSVPSYEEGHKGGRSNGFQLVAADRGADWLLCAPACGLRRLGRIRLAAKTGVGWRMFYLHSLVARRLMNWMVLVWHIPRSLIRALSQRRVHLPYLVCYLLCI